MLHSRKEREKLEDDFLAPYAAHSAHSLGRIHPEQPHPHRSEFQRDRDRIIHCRAFRRLEYKTQVFVNGTADHYRTRLTHTIEVAAVARTIARALRVNEDLTEAIALAHDIGHSPFGHSGEEALNHLMKEHGGFDHNLQSLRWVEHLESRYPHFPGLNLTWETRAGLRKHVSRQPGAQLDGHPLGPFQFMEAQIADTSDEIVYYAHDVDDGLEAGLITDAGLQSLEIWQRAREHAIRQHPDMDKTERITATVRGLLDLQVEDILQHSMRQIDKFRPGTPREVMQAPEKVVSCSPAMREQLKPLREFLFRNVYWHPAVSEANREAVRMMKLLFKYYIVHPECMGSKARQRMEADGLWRAACDYVSGMTDRYALDEYMRYGLDKHHDKKDQL